MDCCLCGPMTHILRPPRNTICISCFEAGRSILRGLHLDHGNQAASDSQQTRELHHHDPSRHCLNIQPKGLAHALESMKELQQTVEAASRKVEFLDSLVLALKTGMHSDIELLTEDGQSIQAHRVVMATKSSVFRAMFEVDSCKAADGGFIRLPELNHKELKYLIQFMYTATLPDEALQDEHAIHALLLAADKYDIPLLIQVCESHIIGTLTRSNALKVLELSTVCSATQMRDMAVRTILRDYENVIYSEAYEEFALKNPMLALLVTKALLQDLKRENAEAGC